MIIDFDIKNKNILVVGGGLEGYRKTLTFVKSGAKVVVISEKFSKNLLQLHEEKKLELQKETIVDAVSFLNRFKNKIDLLVAITDNSKLNDDLVISAKAKGIMVYAPHRPTLSNFSLPAVTKIGDVQIAISTSGKSPAMASFLRKKIEKIITPDDLLQIKLQSELRQIISKRIENYKTRKKFLYQVLEDQKIKNLLKEGKYQEGKEFAQKLIENYTSLNQNK